MKRLITLTSVMAAAFFTTYAPAQVVVNDQLTATQLVTDIFQGVGVTISSVMINGQPGETTIIPAAGGFTYEGAPIIPSAGVILSSGNTTSAAGPASLLAQAFLSTGSDPDLAMLAGATIFDATVLEFDFVPDQDLLLFEYVMASEEYPSNMCTVYNDPFGCFVSGPGIEGPYTNAAANMALLPGTQSPVTVNNVHGGYNNDPLSTNCPPINAEYFHDNMGGQHLTYNGMTVLLQATLEVVPNVPYHIKLAISDAGDQGHDSAVFLQEASFRSVPMLSTGLADRAPKNELKSWFNANGDLVLDASDQIGMIRLYDAQGRLLSQHAPNASGQTILSTRTSVGVYLVEALVAGHVNRLKVVKQ